MNLKLALSLLLCSAALAAGCAKDEPAAEPDPADLAALEAQAGGPAEATDAEPAPMPPPEEMMAMGPAGAVIDTTPVDTVITSVESGNAGTDTGLTGVPGDIFGPQDTIFLDIRTLGTAPTYTISSRWFRPDGTVISEDSKVIEGAGPTSTVFSMSEPDGWRPGTYKVELSINGKLQQAKEFVVR